MTDILTSDYIKKYTREVSVHNSKDGPFIYIFLTNDGIIQPNDKVDDGYGDQGFSIPIKESFFDEIYDAISKGLTKKIISGENRDYTIKDGKIKYLWICPDDPEYH